MTVVLTIIVIAILILFHEAGHFIAARRVGIPVYEFSLGFGYKLVSWRKDGVEYSIRIFPLGGFVRMAGEEPGDHENPNGFNKRTPWEKIKVTFAGPFMNFVLAVLIFIFSFAVIGIPNSTDEPVIGKVLAGEPAAAAGLKAGDRVLEINGEAISTWSEVTEVLAAQTAGKEINIQVERDGKVTDLYVTPVLNSSTGLPAIGVLSQIVYERQDLFTSIKIGIIQTYQFTAAVLAGFGLLITGGASTAELAGPVGIASLIGEAAQVGIVFLLNFAAFLSINLGVLNLLPIPALDGSRIVFAIVEAIRRKPVEPEKEGFIHWLGFMFLMLLVVIVTFNDIIKLW